MKRLLFATCLGFGLAAAPAAHAAAYIKFDGVDGEAMHQGHKGWIEIESWSWGMSQTGGRAASGGSPPAGAKFANITLKRGDKASPQLMKRCATGEHIKSATLSIDGQLYQMENIVMPACGGSSGDRPMESISLNFTKIEMSAAAKKGDSATKASWNLKENVK